MPDSPNSFQDPARDPQKKSPEVQSVDFSQPVDSAMPAIPVDEIEQTDATGGLIPYKNVPALVGYYFAVFSLIPGLGNILGLVAVIMGVVGLRQRARSPNARGGIHCWIAIILGGITFLFYNGAILLLVLNF